jgi:tetratricopeptide (TPR) repeat protein
MRWRWLRTLTLRIINTVQRSNHTGKLWSGFPLCPACTPPSLTFTGTRDEEEKEHRIEPAACSTQQFACDFQAGRYEVLIAPLSSYATAESWYWQSKAYARMSVSAFARLGELPPSAESHEVLAQANADKEDFRACVEELQEAQKLAPNNPEIEKNLAIAFRRIGDQRSALPILEGLIKRQPGRSEVNYLLGDTLLGLHQPAQAIPFLKKAVALDSDLQVARGTLGRAYLENGQAQEAIPYLEASLSTDNDGTLHYQLSRAYQHEGQTARSDEMIKRYQEIRSAQAREKQSPRIEPPPSSP